MRILFVHPDDHSGGAEIAGNWPPAGVACLPGALEQAGFTDVQFIDAMTNDIGDEELKRRIAEAGPDIVVTTAITPSIDKAERVLEMAREVCRGAVTVLGGVHATFMSKQALPEAPWIDAIVRDEGEEIMVAFAQAVVAGRWSAVRAAIKGIAYLDDGKVSQPRLRPLSRLLTA